MFVVTPTPSHDAIGYIIGIQLVHQVLFRQGDDGAGQRRYQEESSRSHLKFSQVYI